MILTSRRVDADKLMSDADERAGENDQGTPLFLACDNPACGKSRLVSHDSKEALQYWADPENNAGGFHDPGEPEKCKWETWLG